MRDTWPPDVRHAPSMRSALDSRLFNWYGDHLTAAPCAPILRPATQTAQTLPPAQSGGLSFPTPSAPSTKPLDT